MYKHAIMMKLYHFSDTEQLYLKVFNNVLEPYKKQFTWEDKATTMGFHTHQIVSYLVKKFDLPMTEDKLRVRLMKDYEAIFPSCKLLPGNILILRLIEWYYEYS